MKAIRWLAAGSVTAFAVYLAYALTWQPFRCNIVKNRVQTLAVRMLNVADGPTVVLRTRQAIADMQRCIAGCPTDVDMYMTLAAHDRLTGRLERAADLYRDALKYDRRPELYFNLGMVQLQMNQRQEAIGTLAKACSYNIYLVEEIFDPEIRNVVGTAARARQARALAESGRK